MAGITIVTAMGGKRGYFQARSDVDFVKALDARAKAEGMPRAEYTRQVLDAALGLSNESIRVQLSKLIQKTRRATTPGLIEAALEYYLPIALRTRLDEHWFPLPDGEEKKRTRPHAQIGEIPRPK